MTDEEILSSVRSGDPLLHNRAIQNLYERKKLNQDIRRNLGSKGASEEEIEEIFQRSIIIFDRQARNVNWQVGDIERYIHGICRNQWLNEIRRKSRIDLGPISDALEEKIVDIEPSPSERMIQIEDSQKMERILLRVHEIAATLDERCQKALSMWSTGESMLAIKNALGGFKNIQSANNKTHRCREKLRKRILKDPELAQYLNNK